MSVTESFLSRLSQKLKAFYLDQQGVYGVMTALLLFPLIVLVAFTVETTGILLDKTRLSQATDQAALLLTAENNNFRAKPDHTDVTRQSLTEEEKQLSEDKQFSTKIAKRNQELVQNTVKLYLRSYDEDASAPITITKDFTAFCEPLSQSGKSEGGVICTVQGDVRRKNGFNVINEWVKSPESEDGRLQVNSGRSYAIKQGGSIPMEVMLVADFSGSMGEELKTQNAKKIDVLRSAVKKLTATLLSGGKKNDMSPYNRVGFTTFNSGIRQWKEDNYCTLPIYPINDKVSEQVEFNIEFEKYFGKIEDLKKDFLKSFNLPSSYLYNCKDIYYEWGESKGQYRGESCQAKDAREEAIKKSMIRGGNYRGLLKDYIDLDKTISQIKGFDGQRRKYPIVLDKPTSACFLKPNQETSQAWFSENNTEIVKSFSDISPNSQTNSSAGMLVGANIMSKPDPDYQKKLDNVGKNVKRTMIILSDGLDNMPYWGAFIDFEKKGFCKEIKAKLDTLQNPKYEKYPTKLAFIAFAYKPEEEDVDHYHAWKRCVDDYYYYVRDEKELLEALGDILGIQEELGTISSQKPTRK